MKLSLPDISNFYHFPPSRIRIQLNKSTKISDPHPLCFILKLVQKGVKLVAEARSGWWKRLAELMVKFDGGGR